MQNIIKNKNEYYQNTKNQLTPWNITLEFLRLNINPGIAIDIGCGMGRDSISLIRNGWEVIAIDKEYLGEMIKENLSSNDVKRLNFQKQYLENLNLEKNNLVIANNSLSFCKKEHFHDMWKKITNSIMLNGYFVGNFFGIKDEWVNSIDKKEMVFFDKSEVTNLFENFTIINFKEIEKDEKTAIGNMKHWHIFEVIANKNFDIMY